MNLKRVCLSFLIAGAVSLAWAYTESDNTGNKTLSGAENVGTVDANGVTISGECSSWMDKDYYRIVPSSSLLSWETDRKGPYGYDPNRSAIKLLDGSGQFVTTILGQGEWSSSGSSQVNAGQTYYIYAYATSSSDDGGNGRQDYEIALKCSGGTPVTRTLTSLSISGAASVTSGSGESYTCTAYYSDGSSSTVSPTWSIESGTSYASVNSSGWLTAYTVTASQSVTLKASYGGKSTTKPITINPQSVPPPSPTLSISPTSANLTSSAQTKSFYVTCNSSWAVAKDSDWITLGTTKGTSSGTVSYSVSAHTKFVARTGYITVTSGTLSRRFEVNQEGCDDNVMVTFNGNGGTVYNLAGQAVGSSIQLAQTPGTKWRNLPDATNGSKTFDGWWTQSSGGTRISTSDTFSGTPTTVYAHWKTPVTPTLSINPTSGDDVDWGGGAGWFSVTCNSSWSVSTSGSWITLSTLSGSNNGTVYFSYDDNDSSSSRLGKITVTCGSLTRTYQFVQLQRKVRIVWDANGGEIPGVDDPVTEMTLGTTFRYPYSATSYDGAFVGWYTSRIGGIKVTSTTAVRDILDEDNPDEIVLYAHWRPWGSPSGLEYFACDEWWCDLGVRDIPFIAAGTHVVYGDGVDEILFVPSTSGWQTIWLHSKATSSAYGYLFAQLRDEQGETLGSLCECAKMSIYLTAGRTYSLSLDEGRFNSTRPSSGDSFAFELQVGGAEPQIAYLDAPAILSVTSTEVRWSEVLGATSYELYKKTAIQSIKPGSPHYGSLVATVPASEGTCCRLMIAPQDVFYVRAVNSKATSWFSDGHEYNPPTYEIQFEDGGVSSPMKTGNLAVIRQLMSSCVCEIGKVYALPACSFGPPVGKTHFAGWVCSNGRRYDDGMLVFDLANPGETVTMTAVWE